jgi:hypothetical protein
LLYLLSAVVPNVPAVQQKIVRLAEKTLRNKLQTDLNIGSIEFELFSKIVLKDLQLSDRNGDTLLCAQRLSAGFELLPLLLHGNLIVSSAQLFTAQLNLRRETVDSPLNLQFVIDAFAGRDSLKPAGMNLHIRTIHIRRSRLTYHVAAADETPGVFNAKHLNVGNISAKIRLPELTNDTVSATVEQLSLKEQSGFEVRRMTFSVTGSPQRLHVHPLELWLPNSHLQIGDLHLGSLSGGTPTVALHIVRAEIMPHDWKAFLPALSNFRENIILKGRIHGALDRLYLSGMQINSRNLSLTAGLSITHPTVPDSARIDGEINRFYITSDGIGKIINNWTTPSPTDAYMIRQLGQVSFFGRLSGCLRDLKASGLISTGCGNLKVDVTTGKNPNFFLRGHILSSLFELNKLFPAKNPCGNITFDIGIDARQDARQKLSGTVNAAIEQFSFLDHIYKNIRFNGDFTDSGFNGKINIDDSFGKLFAEGLFKINDHAATFDFRARAEQIRPDELNLSKKYPGSNLSFVVDANFTGNTPENMQGSISVNRFSFQTADDHLLLDSIVIRSSGAENFRRISLQSDIAQLELSGNYSLSLLLPAIRQTLHRYLPAIVDPPEKTVTDKMNCRLEAHIENTEHLTNVFRLPITVFRQSHLHGYYDHSGGAFDLHASFPKLNWGNMQMENIDLSLNNAQQTPHLSLKGLRYGKFDVKTDFNLQLTAGDNLLKSSLEWKNREQSIYQGQLSAIARFIPPGDKLSQKKITVDLLPTQVTFNDIAWTIHPAGISVEGDRIAINHLNVEHGDQFIKINGTISNDTTDYLFIDLKKVNLDYVFNALVIPSLDFGGVATGSAALNDLYHSRKLDVGLQVENFSFNQAVMGNLNLNCSWDNSRQGIAMTGNAYTNDTTQIAINGMIYPADEKLSIHFGSRNANAAFLRKYIDSVTSGFSGKINGDIHLYGNFKDINVGGDIFVRDGRFGIPTLNTVYTFSDSVYLNENNIRLKNALLYDSSGNSATANGLVRHRHFRNFYYEADVRANNFQIYNATERQNPVFFGAAFGTGNISIHGNDLVDEVNIDINMRTDEHTKLSLNLNDRAQVKEYNFITFVSRKDTTGGSSRQIDVPPNTSPSRTNIKLNLMLSVTPDAMLELYMDPSSDDKIKAWGKGNLQIQYGTEISPRIYGNYSLENGTYNFSLQQVIHKDFRIREGSAISFQGDPNAAILNIDAIHSVSANLGDLDNSFSVEQATPMSSVMVNCLLNIDGELRHPAITFDIELPNSSSELERQVKGIVNTEEMMNRQIIFLLALGRFYTEENISGRSNNDFANVASSTFSTQLTGLLGPLSEKFQIGTNIHTNNYDEYTDTEVKVLLSSQLLNNRLLINGNLGYKDHSTDQTSFIGDFDLEYKLTKTGNFRLKAYNHYNDKYYYVKSALTTQGVGILFRRDFDDMYDFFKPNRQTD